MSKALRSSLWVIFLAILLLGVPRLSGVAASIFDYRRIDPDGAFAWFSVHHIVQAAIFIILIFVIKRLRRIDFGFNWGNMEIGKKYILSFTIIFGAGSLATHLLMILTSSFQIFPYPLTAVNIIGQLGFQLFLSGPSEELIFRAFAITMLALVLKKRVAGGKASAANIIAAVIFGMAHMSFSFSPLSVAYQPFQVLLSVTLGVIYGDCYEKTRSMFYPMILHSISNIIMVGYTIIATAIISLS